MNGKQLYKVRLDGSYSYKWVWASGWDDAEEKVKQDWLSACEDGKLKLDSDGSLIIPGMNGLEFKIKEIEMVTDRIIT